jgi:hypothetical protein
VKFCVLGACQNVFKLCMKHFFFTAVYHDVIVKLKGYVYNKRKPILCW